ncbi:MAG: transposase [Candidatus Nomurabacteria bacterium]|jgi:hypothetical protein|nr:transposase [Candidatus Nomurabacteria bacterium]
MSPITIITNINQLTKTKLAPVLPKKWLPQFQFGLKAYSLRTFHSASSNARQVVANPNTASRKSERLLANIGLAANLATAFDNLNLIKASSYVNCDHSDMNGLTAFVGAVQTRNGRAIPCLIETTYSDRLPGPSLTTSPKRKLALRQARAEERQLIGFTEHYINALQSLASRLGFWPKLVFDRGFGNKSLVTYLDAAGATFYIRLKAGRFVELDGQSIEVKRLVENDTIINLFGLKLRVVRSPKSRRATEPWYILTNDLTSTKAKIVKIYYHRFEIEETFKDLKHIWNLKRTRLNKPNSLKVILWLVSIGIASLYKVTKPTKQTVRKRHKKKRNSWLRQAYEQLQRASSLVLWGMG